MIDLIGDLIHRIVSRPVDERRQPLPVDAATYGIVHLQLTHRIGRQLLAADVAGGPRPNFLLCGVPIYPVYGWQSPLV